MGISHGVMTVKGLASTSREHVAYVVGILGNRRRSRCNGGNALGLFHAALSEREGVVPYPAR